MNNRKIFSFAILALSIMLGACKKADSGGCNFSESSTVAPASEIATLQAYVSATHPAAIQHPSGFFYEITAAGSGASPSICSAVTIKYSGYLLNGTKFDENLTGATFTLGQLIVGLQKALPLIQKGGSMNVFIPPSLGYGSGTVGVIPANSNLIFVIQLADVQ